MYDIIVLMVNELCICIVSCFLEISKVVTLWYKHVSFQRLTQLILSSFAAYFAIFHYICYTICVSVTSLLWNT